MNHELRITNIVVIILYFLFFIPAFTQAQDLGLIVCERTANDPCTWDKLIELARQLIKALVIISTFLAGAVFAYAGLQLLLAGGNETKFKGAITMIKKVGIGYLWILAAWLVVYTISEALLNPGFSLLGTPTSN
jgi:hypothetical protein